MTYQFFEEVFFTKRIQQRGFFVWHFYDQPKKQVPTYALLKKFLPQDTPRWFFRYFFSRLHRGFNWDPPPSPAKESIASHSILVFKSHVPFIYIYIYAPWIYFLPWNSKLKLSIRVVFRATLDEIDLKNVNLKRIGQL